MRLIAYTRVSTDKQAEHGMGLDVQRSAIRAWAKAEGHRIVAWHSDEGVSGAKGLDVNNGLTTRPGLAAAFTALENHEADALVVYRLDRLSRKQGHQEVWIERMENIGCQVISVTEPGYGEDEIRNLVRQILGAVAEYERVVIVKRMQGGRAAKHAKGGYAYGSPPYGWKAQDGELARDEAEQQVRAKMAELRAQGCSYGSIAGRLNLEGIPARRGRWHGMTVKRALEQRTDAGGRP
jgi:DNA invertase Pin-like site-specific DNA recombinase